ncbi:DUF4270 family protein [Fulvivirgaceae bacterium BMA10]|uniref:DUF4270 family protein n=1 Tax=Splendidivirga corallicola TaxID=3051826 RepID=A0ABT8KTA0_9BACT|nr:DUF4270 family protein [Fulvivirgaceae bacterium BMA10]
MNLLDKKFGLALLLGLFLWACEDPNEIGLNLDPDIQNLEILFTEIPLETNMVLLDSNNTANNGRMLVGKQVDPVFGSLTATAYTELFPSSGTLTIPDDATVDSLVLSLRGNYSYGKNFTDPQSIEIYQLADTLSIFERYISTTPFPRENTSIGQGQVVIEPDSASSFTITTHLTNDYAEWLFGKMKTIDTLLRNVDNLNNVIKGFAIEPGPNSSAVLGFNNLNTDSTRLTIYFSSPDDTESTAYAFYFNRNTTLLNGNRYYSRLDYNRTGTPLEVIDNVHTEFAPVNDLVYGKAGVGLLPKVNLNAVREFLNAHENIVINRADLVIEEVQSFENNESPAQSISFNLVDEDNKLQFAVNPFTGSSALVLRTIQRDGTGLGAALPVLDQPLTVPFNDNGDAFVGTMSLSIQAFKEGLLSDEDLFINAVNRSNTVNQFVFNTSKIKLKVFYSTFD